MNWSPKVAQIVYDLDHWLAVQVLQQNLSIDERKELARALREYLGPVPEAAKLESNCTVGAGVLSRSYTREVAAIAAELAKDTRSVELLLQEKCTFCGQSICCCLNSADGPPFYVEARTVVHVLDQSDQPYGSERRCCNHCGIMIASPARTKYVDNWSTWRAAPYNCGKVKGV